MTEEKSREDVISEQLQLQEMNRPPEPTRFEDALKTGRPIRALRPANKYYKKYGAPFSVWVYPAVKGWMDINSGEIIIFSRDQYLYWPWEAMP